MSVPIFLYIVLLIFLLKIGVNYPYALYFCSARLKVISRVKPKRKQQGTWKAIRSEYASNEYHETFTAAETPKKKSKLIRLRKACFP